jgi:hypothetical protein
MSGIEIFILVGINIQGSMYLITAFFMLLPCRRQPIISHPYYFRPACCDISKTPL